MLLLNKSMFAFWEPGWSHPEEAEDRGPPTLLLRFAMCPTPVLGSYPFSIASWGNEGVRMKEMGRTHY